MKKIVIIGGGSYTWSPIFMHEIASHPVTQDARLVLMDLDQERLDLLYDLGMKMIADRGSGLVIEKTTSLEGALQGADFILLTITTGGLDAMRVDLEVPARYGTQQSVGDTTGPGGLSRALRNIPVVAEIGRQVAQTCPKALLLNYTNPMTTLTRVLSMQGVRVLGLCHEWAGVRKKLAPLLGVAPEGLTPRIAGINHLIWLTELRADGQDVWSMLTIVMDKVLSGEIVVDEGDITVFADRFLVKARLFKAFGALPVAGDRHLAEFFPHFITEGTNWGQDYRFRLTGIEERMGVEFFARMLLESILRGDTPLEPALEQLSSEDAADIIAAAMTGEPYIGLMNLPNVGQIANLPQEAVVETMGIVDQAGPQPITFGTLPPGLQAILERHIRSQEMTIEAALAGDRALALQVVLNDPLSSRLTLDQAEALLDEMLEANRAYLPAFFE